MTRIAGNDRLHARCLSSQARFLGTVWGTVWATVWASLLAFGSGCLSPPAETAPPVTQEMLRDAIDALPPLEPGGLRVALAFAGDTDLDLGVTDPNLNSIRFTEPRGAGGARFSADRGCGDPAPRVEIVEWKSACPGRFEISIEHASDCAQPGPEEEEAARRWQLRIDHAGVEWKEGIVEHEAFVPIFFEVEGTSASARDCGP